jgi:hypothetical protein
MDQQFWAQLIGTVVGGPVATAGAVMMLILGTATDYECMQAQKPTPVRKLSRRSSRRTMPDPQRRCGAGGPNALNATLRERPALTAAGYPALVLVKGRFVDSPVASLMTINSPMSSRCNCSLAFRSSMP